MLQFYNLFNQNLAFILKDEPYETIYEKHIDNILEIPAIVIANLCVSCIMVN